MQQPFSVCGQTKEPAQINTKVKGLGQAFFPKGLRVSRGRSHLVAARKQRNLFADGRNDLTVSRQTKNPQSRLHRKFKVKQMNLISQTILELFHAGGLKPRAVPSGTTILVSAVRRRYGQTGKIETQRAVTA